jgi:succinyl-CoA synthetase alpha subunit
MSILIDKNTKVLVQGITGSAGSFHTKKCIEYGTKIVAGVTPGKGGTIHEGVPVFNTVKEAIKEIPVDATMIFVPAQFAYDAIIEACDAGIKLIVTITEGIPALDMAKVKSYMSKTQSRLIGPNSPGMITPEECKIGIMPGYIHKKGCIGIISRSGTLTYEAVWQITKIGLGQSTCIGIGGDPILGSEFVDLLPLFEKDDETKAVLMIGEIGGTAEIDAAKYIQKNMKKPVIAFIAGKTAPPGKRMGHAGAIISGGSDTAEAKIKILKEYGVHVVENPSEIGKVCYEVVKNYK